MHLGFDAGFLELCTRTMVPYSEFGMSHSFSALAWGLERSQDCHVWSDSSFWLLEGHEMMIRCDTVASNELGSPVLLPFGPSMI